MSATTRKAKMANLVVENRRLEELVYNQAIHIRVLADQRNEARRLAVNFYTRLERIKNERDELKRKRDLMEQFERSRWMRGEWRR